MGTSTHWENPFLKGVYKQIYKVGEMAIGEMAIGEVAIGEMANFVGEMAIGEMAINRFTIT